MAGLNQAGLLAAPIRGQFAAIADLRWRLFVNGLRSRRGRMELASRIIVTGAFALGGLGMFAFSTLGSWYFLSQGKPEMLAVILWPIFFFWQFFPVMSAAFTNNPDSSDLLRFPLNYRSYFLIRLVYGAFDPACGLGSLALFGMLLGITVAHPTLFPWALLVLLVYAAFNLVLMQTVFAWVERWLAQRRTREIFGVLFVLFALSFQLIGPALQHLDKHPQPGFRRAAEIVIRVQAVLPPGTAASAIAQTYESKYFSGFASLVFLAILTLALGSLLHLRLGAQFRGENLNEANARPAVATVQGLQTGWDIPGFSQPVAAVFEKEVRYLSRSGPMLLALIMPVITLVVFRLGAMNPMRSSNSLSREMAFPAAAAYSLLVLTNLLYNSFGGDGGGIQFFFASPVRFSQILLAKNLTHAGILAINTMLAWIAVAYLYRPPELAVSVATLAGLLFAAPLNFTAGNLLSLYSPKKRDFARFGRQNVSQITLLASLGLQVFIVGVGVAAFTIARLYQNLWIATLIFLALSLISLPLYVWVLQNIDTIAFKRRETLIEELCRA